MAPFHMWRPRGKYYRATKTCALRVRGSNSENNVPFVGSYNPEVPTTTTPRRSTVLLEKLIVTQSTNPTHFMEPESSSPYSQEPPAVPILSQMNQIPTLPFYSCNTHFDTTKVRPSPIVIFSNMLASYMSRDSSICIALGYGLNDRSSRVPFPAGAGNFSLHHRVQNGSGAYPASYRMGTRVSFPGGKAAGTWI
jgi:hypothetical protein